MYDDADGSFEELKKPNHGEKKVATAGGAQALQLSLSRDVS